MLAITERSVSRSATTRTFANTGTIETLPGSGGTRTLFRGLNNSGTMTIGADTDGAYNNAASLQLTNTGTLTVASGRTFTLGSGFTQAGGLLTVEGALAVQVAGAAAGTGYSQLAVSGNATVARALNVTTLTPQTGSFRILTAKALTGTFAPVNFTGQNYSVTYAPTGATLSTGGTPDTKARQDRQPEAEVRVYRTTAVATDPAGNHSKPRQVVIKVVRR